MAYNRDQQSQTAKPKQRPLTPAELEMATTFTKRWDATQLQLLWKRKMPPEASLEDLQLFLYICEKRGHDPLLGEIYARLQWDSDAGEKRLIVIDSIHGLLRAADETGQLNGIREEVSEDESGNIILARAIVHRKGCEFPFEAVAHYSEYVGRNSGGQVTRMWAEKGRIMLAKCALALALRLAFPAALAGVYVKEELDREDNSASPSDNFQVGERKDPGFGTHIKEAVEIVKDWVEEKQSSMPPFDSDVPRGTSEDRTEGDQPLHEQMPDQSLIKQKNKALVQRLMLDLDIPKELRETILKDYYRGYLGVEDLPLEPAVFTPCLEALDVFVTQDPRKAREDMVSFPRDVGKALRARSEERTTVK